MAQVAGELQLRRGTTVEHGSFTGAEAEVTVDTDKDTLVVHDGVTAGGHAVAKEVDLTSETVARLEADETLNTKIDTEKKETVDTALAFSIALG